MRSDLKRLAGPGSVLAAALFFGGCDQILGPTHVDDNWRVSERGRFAFYVRPDSFAERSLDTLSTVLEDQYDTAVARLGLTYSGRVSMFLFNSGTDAGFGNDNGGGNHSGTAYSMTASVRVACVPPLDIHLFSLLTHEANHVITQNGLGRPGTSFVSEGLASAVISERHGAYGRTFYYEWTAARRTQLPPIAALVDDAKWSGYQQPVSYGVSASFLAYLLETYGPVPFRSIYYAGSRDFAATFASAYGRPLDVAEREWIDFCVRRAGT